MKFASTRFALPIVAMALVASPAVAQTAGSGAGGETGMPGAAQQQFSDKKLENFAEAVIDVNKVTEDFSAQLDQGGDGDALRQEAQKEMIQAIRDTGLSLDEYNTIATAAQNNPQIAQTIEQHLREKQ
ncbi:DUF4168 domain-containing protein [Caenispirillum salinarum]|uniref:DUF4168 domain-containing protein n=1 Tax=Caenispirillum salinarum TaxID=859058 RepID=UPI00384AA8CD